MALCGFDFPCDELFFDSQTFFFFFTGDGDTHFDDDEVFMDASGDDLDSIEDCDEDFFSTEIFLDCETDSFVVSDEYAEQEEVQIRSEFSSSVHQVVAEAENEQNVYIFEEGLSGLVYPAGHIPHDIIAEEGTFLDDVSDEIQEEFDFREQEINAPEWAVDLFNLPHAGNWTVYDIAAYDPMDQLEGRTAANQEIEEEEEDFEINRNRLFNGVFNSSEGDDMMLCGMENDDISNTRDELDFRLQEIDVPEWAVDLFGLPHAGKWAVYDIAGYDAMDRLEEGQITSPTGKKDKWIKKIYRRACAKFSFDSFVGCFGCVRADDCNVA